MKHARSKQASNAITSNSEGKGVGQEVQVGEKKPGASAVQLWGAGKGGIGKSEGEGENVVSTTNHVQIPL